MGKPTITLYIDTVSPFAYIAFHVIRYDAAFRDCDIVYVPVFLGGLMKACNNRPPIQIKNKDKWINEERIRWAELFDVPMNPGMPPSFPPFTLNVMRQLVALDEADRAAGKSQERLVRCIEALYRAFFVDHQNHHEPATLSRVLASTLGSEEEAQKLAAAAGTAETKDALARNTDAAFQAGAFGLPWVTCTNAEGRTESFWGVDHLGLAATFLGREKPQSKAWKSLL
jgi:2-hydroxychromene-2-carboxylate isomerase